MPLISSQKTLVSVTKLLVCYDEILVQCRVLSLILKGG